jgi:hypothetical protein
VIGGLRVTNQTLFGVLEGPPMPFNGVLGLHPETGNHTDDFYLFRMAEQGKIESDEKIIGLYIAEQGSQMETTMKIGEVDYNKVEAYNFSTGIRWVDVEL